MSAASADRTSCHACELGTHDDDSDASTACVACDPGTFAPLESTVCVDCAAGSYSVGSVDVCADCGSGTYQDGTGETQCKKCTAGAFCPAAASAALPTDGEGKLASEKGGWQSEEVSRARRLQQAAHSLRQQLMPPAPPPKPGARSNDDKATEMAPLKAP